MDESAQVNRYISCLGKMKSERMNYDSWCQEVADLTLPKRDFTTSREPNTKRNQNIYDSTGVYCTTMLASGLHGNLTPSTTKWFDFTAPDDIDDEGREWLDDASNTLFNSFAAPSSMFASQSFECYLDLVAFGQAVMIPMYFQGQIIYVARPLNACWVKQNSAGIIDTLYYVEKLAAIEMIRMFGADKVDKVVNEAYERGQDTKYEVLHVVEPRDEHYGHGAVAEKKPFKSCYIDISNKKMMKESGFDTFPYLVPRFSKRAGETYGYGPGLDAICEVKTLNKFSEVMFRAAAKNVDPPVLAPVEGLVLPMRLDPNGINYYDPTLGKPEFWSNGFQPNYLQALIDQKQALVKSMYYIDWMNMPDRSRMSASEYIGRSQEAMRIMSPTNSRMEAEFLTRLIERSLILHIDNNLLEPPPPSLQGKIASIKYISPLAQAQRTATANNVLSGIGVALQLAQGDPSVMANINSNKIFRDQALETFNWPIEYLNTEEEVQAAQDAAKQQQAASSEAQIAETYSKAAKNGAGAMGDMGV